MQHIRSQVEFGEIRIRKIRGRAIGEGLSMLLGIARSENKDSHGTL